MPLALCCMSHSPLLDLPGPSRELLENVEGAMAQARDAVLEFDPDLVVIFAPDHYNGFFYKAMPPFCVGTAASGVGDYSTPSGPLDVPEAIARGLAEAAWADGVDVAISTRMDVDHGTVQPLARLFGTITAKPVVPIFINSVAAPLGPLRRTRMLGRAVGRYLLTLERRVLIVGSGGLSHDPPVPTLETATEAVRERIVAGRPLSSAERAARQDAVIAAAAEFARGEGSLQELNPDWDHRVLQMFDEGRLEEFDDWTNEQIAAEAGNSAHETRTWVAAFSALSEAGPYRVATQYYRAVPELIAGFAVRTAFAA
ncbi:MAG: 3-carboxyethylcatechol 2,3-dioxygenase [Nocardioidaceae bacterium]